MTDPLRDEDAPTSGWSLTPEIADCATSTVWRVGVEYPDGTWAGHWHFADDASGKEYADRHFKTEGEWSNRGGNADRRVWVRDISESGTVVVEEIPVFDSPDDIR